MINKDLIYDVGMNNGLDTAYYLYKGYKVVAIEADPILAQNATLKFNTFIKRGQLVILNIGITKDNGVSTFYINDDNSEWNSFDQNIASRNSSKYHSIEIQCLNFSEILREHGIPFYLKIDIEGNDMLCVEELYNFPLPQYISVEASNIDQILFLKNIGYTKFMCVDQTNYFPITIPELDQSLLFKKYSKLQISPQILKKAFRALGGRKIIKKNLLKAKEIFDYDFKAGCSGSFGPHLPNVWANYEQMALYWLNERNKRAPNNAYVNNFNFWCDFHASKD